MKRVTRIAIDGQEIVTLIPETDSDLDELARLESEGKLDLGDGLHNGSVPTDVRTSRPKTRRQSAVKPS